MYKKIFITLGCFLPLFINSGTTSVDVTIPKRHDKPTEQQDRANQKILDAIKLLTQATEKHNAIALNQSSSIHETSKTVVYSIIFQLNPYEIIGKTSAYYAFESKNELLQKAYAILKKTQCIGETSFGETSYPSIDKIAASAEKITALYEAKTLVECYEKIKELR